MEEGLKAIWKEFLFIRDTIQLKNLNKQKVEYSEFKKWNELRNHLLANYYTLIKKVAYKMKKRIKELSVDELSSLGVDGLYNAIDNYDPNYKNKFETYADLKIRGGILDAIRKIDWVPRLVRTRYKAVEEKRHELEQTLGRTPTDDEMAKSMNLTTEEYWELLQASKIKSVQSMNVSYADGSGEDGEGECSLSETIPNKKEKTPIEDMLRNEMFSKLFGNSFTETEKRIIIEYHVEEKPMKQIAKEIGLCESRVSQLNSDILKKLKEKIKKNPEYFKDYLHLIKR